jgi:DNA-binding Xre family transcriptional regulator
MFRELINARLAQLDVKVGDVCDALGISYQAFGAMKRRRNIQFETLQRLALALALPVDVLASRSLRAALCDVPDWRWLDALKHWRLTSDDVQTPDWHEFEERYSQEFGDAQ